MLKSLYKGCFSSGAGVLPFYVKENGIFFLFHETKVGKKKGTLIDFGGGAKKDESLVQTAAREFSGGDKVLFNLML
jgi:8-oxo-dGTP pyrophosphatase MutT (NUDIX family)